MRQIDPVQFSLCAIFEKLAPKSQWRGPDRSLTVNWRHTAILPDARQSIAQNGDYEKDVDIDIIEIYMRKNNLNIMWKLNFFQVLALIVLL